VCQSPQSRPLHPNGGRPSLDLSELSVRARCATGNAKRIFWKAADELILFKIRSVYSGMTMRSIVIYS
jgi:hypothetical protein